MKYLLLFLLFTACGTDYVYESGSLDTLSDTLTIAPETLSVDLDVAVILQSGGVTRYELIGDSLFLSYLEIDTADSLNSTLSFKNSSDYIFRGDELTLSITTPTPDLIQLKNASIENLLQIQRDAFSLELSGNSSCSLSVDLNKLHLKLHDSASCEVSGYAYSQEVYQGSSSDLDLSSFVSINAVCTLSSSGDLILPKLQMVEGELSGSGDLYLHGSPTVRVVDSGSGSIIND